MLDKIKIYYPEDELIIAPGLDEGIIGVEESGRIIYSVSKCREILEKEGMEEEYAHEYLENMKMQWFGDKTPIWCLDDL
jgi:hypothetical protein